MPDESALWDAYESSQSIEARNDLVAYYMPFVGYLAGRLLARLPPSALIELDDLINDAVPALIELFETFDRSRRLKFVTYANTRLRGAMLDALRDRDWVPRLERMRQKRDPEHRVTRIIALTTVPRSDGDDDFRHDSDFRLPVVESKPTKLDDDQFWFDVCRGLDKTDRLIVVLYFREGLTMKAVGRHVGFSESRVSQRMSAIMVRLRGRKDVEFLKSA